MIINLINTKRKIRKIEGIIESNFNTLLNTTPENVDKILNHNSLRLDHATKFPKLQEAFHYEAHQVFFSKIFIIIHRFNKKKFVSNDNLQYAINEKIYGHYIHLTSIFAIIATFLKSMFTNTFLVISKTIIGVDF